MSEYYLAPCLVRLRNEVDSAYPNRDRSSDGWVGDASHAASVSDHNPDYYNSGVVRALDIDKDGIDPNRLTSIVKNDSRVEYVIWAGYIYSRPYGFSKRIYTGINGHFSHVHISVRHGYGYENDVRGWGYGASRPISTTPSSPGKLSVDGQFGQLTVKALQLALNKRGARLVADGLFGNASARALQSALSVTSDGQVGPVTIKALQRRLGVSTDGVWGPMTTRALQNRLNSGSF